MMGIVRKVVKWASSRESGGDNDMPSSGYPMEDFAVDPDNIKYIRAIEEDAKLAMEHGLFTEWLECFIGAYNHIRKSQPKTATWRAANIASQAGVEEWDL